ncbi:glycoprotein A33 (transmembrane), paralog a isoform X2 [Danio aesculapii]|uniref:glycoprotein A33 (transmembrane), paralog a isoform X2 n=1 Tax=Danio aesculapii TaxID=1142201 RepID=UPI0024C07394|nr:glycoprotein A33 (transmembrane), paralog a isoform X2 [Danio aesculapii]
MADTLRLLGFILLLSGLRVASAAIVVDIPQKQYKIARGDNVTLPCTFTPPPPAESTTLITWRAASDVPDSPMIDIISFVSPTAVKVTTKYKGRASLIYDLTKGKADLQLLRVTSADTRTYECHVNVVQDEEDGTPSDTANLIVLVAPSTPKCTIEGKTEYFQDITLTCKSEEGTPTPTYKWQSYDVLNNPRPNPPKATDLNGILSLYNISKDTSGFYVCTSTNEIKSAKCNLTMAVMAPSMSMASTAGIIGAAAGALLLLLVIIIICCCCRRRKNNKAEEYAMGTPEDGEFTDKDPEEEDEHVRSEQERPVKSADRRDVQDERSERSYDRRSDYDDRRDQNISQRDDRDDRYDDRRDRYNDRRDRNDDRQERYDDRRERNGDRQDRYDDRRDRNDDRRDRYDDHYDRYDDRHDRYDDRRDRHDDRYDSDRYSDRYDSRDRPPSVPPNKPRDPRN